MSLKQIASQVIRVSLNVKQGEMVRINTWEHSLELASELAIECYRLGALPLITLMTDRVFCDGLSVASTETLALTPRHEQNMLKELDAQVLISGPTSPDTLKSVTPAKIHAYRQGGALLSKIQREKGIRTVQLHLGKVTKQRAKKYGFNFEQWQRSMVEALTIDYYKIQKNGKSLMEKLMHGQTMLIKTRTGSNLKFEIDHGSILLDDGIIDEDDTSAQRFVTNLPAGILDVSPIPGTANGTLITDAPQFRIGETIPKISMDFKDGLLINLKAYQKQEAIDTTLQRICTQQPILTSVGFGLNPGMKDGNLFDEIIHGKISVAVGGNTSSCFISAVLKDTNVFVDGEPLSFE